jgi:hypothetical protein
MSQSVSEAIPTTAPTNGCVREIDGSRRVFYDGYWIKHYAPPEDTLAAKKRLIQALTRRLFNHVEHGINIPGRRLEEALQAYEQESDPARKRVNQAMLAGAYFNRAADIFTKLVELQELGVAINQRNELMRECGQCLLHALDLGKAVRHRNGDESIDELWGEPFKAFTIPIQDFYSSRYVKIAQTMRDIDHIAGALAETLACCPVFGGIAPLVHEFAEAAKRKCETLRTDPVIFDVWPSFVVAGDRMTEFARALAANPEGETASRIEEGAQLIEDGKALLTHITRARVAMPKSSAEFLARCERFRHSAD